ncbi:MAG: histidine kinase [Flavisolibacter sp.]|jgi:sensor histidine kinase YesM|nr:histidine kinase [Flavisolibacter sp.]
MRNLISKPENFNRLEFWAATTIFVFIIFFHITDALTGHTVYEVGIEKQNAPFSYYFVSQLIRYIVLYASFIFLNFYVVPRLVKKEDTWLNIFSMLLIFLIVALTLGVTGTYLKDQFLPGSVGEPFYVVYQKTILFAAWLLLAFGFYSVIRYASIYMLSHSEAIHEKYRFLKPGTLVATVFWMITMFLLLTSDASREFNAGYAIVIPFSIFLYTYSFHLLIPASLSRSKSFRAYLGKTFVVLILAFIPVALLGGLLTQNGEGGFAISAFNSFVQLLVVAPFSWVLFKRYLKGNEEIYILKKELGRSHANLDFLRSQINPHFLFNALNTIYGTAIQEGAERTSAGIEKLGDMMRFMLQENMQEKIALSREIEYLENYISLQKLRTETKSNISIQSDIQQPVGTIQIAPMLLIPFVENAFKHGISFREPSYINITLELRDKELHFDVSNSKHVQQENDPEKGKSGIGLDNVQQRLQLIYPGRHELVTRETRKDFFVHLTLKLS